MPTPAPGDDGFPYLGQIAAFAFDFAPQGWLACDGSLLQIQDNTALFALLGTTYGGDGTTTFALPTLAPAGPNGPGYFIAVNATFPNHG